MIASKWKQDLINIKVRRENIKELKEFKYLGGLITYDEKNITEIKKMLNMIIRRRDRMMEHSFVLMLKGIN